MSVRLLMRLPLCIEMQLGRAGEMACMLLFSSKCATSPATSAARVHKMVFRHVRLLWDHSQMTSKLVEGNFSFIKEGRMHDLHSENADKGEGLKIPRKFI